MSVRNYFPGDHLKFPVFPVSVATLQEVMGSTNDSARGIPYYSGNRRVFHYWSRSK